MVILDVTVINVAVPVIGRELSASLTGIQWITDGYTLVFAGLLLTGGALGDRLGSRRIFCSGVAMFTVSSLIAALNEAGRRGWSDPAVLAGVGLAVLAAAAFAVRERLARSPALPLSLLRSRTMSGGAVIGLLFNFGFSDMVFTAGLEFQHQRGFSALETGPALFPAVAMAMFASVLSGWLPRRTGDRPLVISGMLLAAPGLAGWASAGADPAYPLLVAPMTAVGFGTSFALTGSTATVMGAAPRRTRGPPPPCSTPPAGSAAPRRSARRQPARHGHRPRHRAAYQHGHRRARHLTAAGLARLRVPAKPQGHGES